MTRGRDASAENRRKGPGVGGTKFQIRIILVLILIVAGVMLWRFIRGAGLMTPLVDVPADCRPLEAPAGSEDIVIDREAGFAFVSATDRRRVMKGGEEAERVRGGIHRIDLREPVDRWSPVRVSGSLPERFRPHGIGLFVDAKGVRSLFVVNHPAGGPDEVVIFDIDGDGGLALRRVVSDPLLTNLNDVQPVGRNAFYATNDHGNRIGTRLQDLLLLNQANLVYYDGSAARVAATGLSYANGVNISPDGREVYVAETIDRALRIYRRDPASGDLTLLEILPVDTGVDNIDVEENGDLLIGAHPRLLDFSKHAVDPEARSPSQVLLVKKRADGGHSVRTLYLDRGESLSGGAVAAGYREWMLLGPVFESKILVCRRDGGVAAS